jgi:hypothetical protein
MLREQADDLQKPPVPFHDLLERFARAVPDLVAAVKEQVKAREGS